jgi:sulfite dehydrogenase
MPKTLTTLTETRGGKACAAAARRTTRAWCAAALTGGWLFAAAPLFAAEDAVYALGKKLFSSVTPPCAICHTLRDANAEGMIGPVLDEIKPDEARVAKALRGGIGSMPSFGGSLKAEEIDALARYVARASGGAEKSR